MSDDLTLLQLPSYGRQSSLRAQIAETLRALLITGRMRPGELYSAPRLAAEFGVSATPVREAMLDLVSEGLVEVVRNKGFRVTELSEHELDAMAELRGLVEPPVMAMVAESCVGESAEAVEALRPLAEALVDAAEREDLVAYIEVDTEFHLRFLELHGNQHVVDTIRLLRSRSRLYGLQELLGTGLIRQQAAEHGQMVDLALAQDAEGMRELMVRHIGYVRQGWAGRKKAEEAQEG